MTDTSCWVFPSGYTATTSLQAKPPIFNFSAQLPVFTLHSKVAHSECRARLIKLSERLDIVRMVSTFRQCKGLRWDGGSRRQPEPDTV